MDGPKPPNPEEIQKEFEDFVRKRFGNNVQVVTQPMGAGQNPFDQEPSESKSSKKASGDKSSPKPEPKEFDLNFRYKPRDIKKHLDDFVIKQDEAKRALAIAVCDHYNHVRQTHNKVAGKATEYSKQNVLVLGPTGVGKTYLIKQIAKLIGVPFVKADATRFSETGYVGSNVDDLVHDLVNQADGDLDLAQYGIIYLDEADKLAAADGKGKDVSGRGVQFGLLKLMEETDVDLRAGNDMRAQMQAFMEFQRKGKVEPKIINTRHILFIISGAFTGLSEIVKERLNQNQIGFSSSKDVIDSEDEVFNYASTQDFINFGFEPEFVGRLPIRVACHHLGVDDLFDILKNSAGSIINQYIDAFKAYGIDISFTDDALHRIAALSAEQRTGARALMTVCENALRGFKFELPSLSIKEFTVTASTIDNPDAELEKIITSYAPIKLHARGEFVEKFAENFEEKHGMKLRFTPSAINKICESAEERGCNIDTLCSELLHSYEHGLKLVEQNTGRSEFVIDEEVVDNPRSVLERWIRKSYQLEEKTKDEIH